MDFKVSGCLGGGGGGGTSSLATSESSSLGGAGGGSGSTGSTGSGGGSNTSSTEHHASPHHHSHHHHQQFNIFPAIFSRQLNFAAAAASANPCTSALQSPTSSVASSNAKLMEDLRPNLVGGLLGVAGLVDDTHHHHHHHNHHSVTVDRLSVVDKRGTGGKCGGGSTTSGSSAEDFSALYALPPGSTGANGGHQHGAATPDNSQQQQHSASGGGSHQHTPTHTPPAGVTRSLSDHTGKLHTLIFFSMLPFHNNIQVPRALHDICSTRTLMKFAKLVNYKPNCSSNDQEKLLAIT